MAAIAENAGEVLQLSRTTVRVAIAENAGEILPKTQDSAGTQNKDGQGSKSETE